MESATDAGKPPRSKLERAGDLAARVSSLQPSDPNLRRSLHAKSMDETIEILERRHRKEALDAAFGSDRAKSRKFTEDDRLEDRS